MVFSSTIFLFFFLPWVLTLTLIVPRRLRNPILLVSSLFFYAWGEAFFVLLMIASIGINYVLGLLIATWRSTPKIRILLALAVLVNIGLLGTFKYANFFVDNLNALLALWDLPPLMLDPVHLPIGISFFTFQALSYIFDVARGEEKAQRNPLNVALYISLFPQLIAGPIVRFRDVAGQILRRRVTLDLFADGVRRFIIGLGKKVLIANTLAVPADQIFALPESELTWSVAWIGVICYTLQIYFDFSGYSDMAIGLGRMLGFRFLENFNYPYIARSMTDFWRRWHISLSSWFRDYLYIPLGGNRRGPTRTFVNLFIVFFITGLWHGASWSFVVWGLYHGAFLVAERVFRNRSAWRFPPVIRHAYLLMAVMVGWVLFRAETLTQALAFLGAMLGFGAGDGLRVDVIAFQGNDVLLAMGAGIVGSAPVIPWLVDRIRRIHEAVPRLGAGTYTVASALGHLGLLAVFVLSAVAVSAQTHNPFIYFRF
ncbi:MAG: MBOAT family O-acyltransferase [Planctomycetota bacterium]|jgi:alginate O-acetyltransferase complex protein AlgI